MAIIPEDILAQPPKITNRAELVTALQAAAELEQMLCCEYLFAGFSVRRTLADFPAGISEASARVTLDRTRPWLAILYQIARQEMDHLGIVCNLLAAVGAEPHFDRPDFPQPASRSLLGIPLALDRLTQTSIQRFIWYERPQYLTPSFSAHVAGLEEWAPPDAEPLEVHGLQIHDLMELYLEIGRAFMTLPAREVFVGDPDRQLGDVFSFRVKLLPIRNREEAQEAIRQILVEGEGIGINPLTATCHFQRFSHMLRLYEEAAAGDPDFAPALPVVTNPLARPHRDDFPVTVITRPETVAVMHYFNDCYFTMLVMLKTFFATLSATSVPTPRPQVALFYGAFFPLMTMAIRPLGELLARMPAGDEYPGQTAGAPFALQQAVPACEDVDWYRDRLQELANRAGELCDAVPDRLRPTMQSLYENLSSTSLHLEHIWKHGR